MVPCVEEYVRQERLAAIAVGNVHTRKHTHTHEKKG